MKFLEKVDPWRQKAYQRLPGAESESRDLLQKDTRLMEIFKH